MLDVLAENRTDVLRHRKFEIIGIIIVCICAPLLHFVYAWLGNNFFVGLFSAVNESVWEHTKIVYFPFLVYSLIELALLKPDFKRFFVSKTIALAFLSLVTISFFYTYTGMFGSELLILDIICTFVWIFLAFLISYRLYYSEYELERYIPIICILFFAQFLAEIMLTPFSPHIPLFMDSETGLYGFG